MRIAVLSDIHGNRHALETVLEEIRKRDIDQIVCLGDIVDPLPASGQVFERLRNLQIPILRGNHEDYVVTAHESPEHEISTAANWEPVRLVAKSLSTQTIQALKDLPLTVSLKGEKAGEILF